MFRFSRHPKSTHSDEELLSGFQRTGQLPWLGMLYERYMEMVYGVCLKYLKAPVEAEDAVMAIFEELTQKVPKHEIESFRPWLYVLARNHCLMFLRKQQKKPTNALDPERMYSEDNLHPIAEEYAEDSNLDRLQDCLESLNEQQKTCVEQFYYQEKSYKDIAEASGQTLGRVRSHIQNGRRNLKICLEEKATKEE